MGNTITTTGSDPAVLAEMRRAIENRIRGTRDRETMRQAAERMDRMREEMRRRVGDVELAVTLLGESRDEA